MESDLDFLVTRTRLCFEVDGLLIRALTRTRNKFGPDGTCSVHLESERGGCKIRVCTHAGPLGGKWGHAPEFACKRDALTTAPSAPLPNTLMPPAWFGNVQQR